MGKSKTFAPDQPVWWCRECSYELFAYGPSHPNGLKPHDEAPDVCPNCGSIDVVNGHLTIMDDPAPSDYGEEL